MSDHGQLSDVVCGQSKSGLHEPSSLSTAAHGGIHETLFNDCIRPISQSDSLLGYGFCIIYQINKKYFIEEIVKPSNDYA